VFGAWFALAFSNREPADCVLARSLVSQPPRRGDLYLNSFLAFWRVNRQLIWVRLWLALRFHALVSRFSIPSPESAACQTLPRVHTEFDFRLVEPASVFRSVVNGEPIPNLAAFRFAEVARHDLRQCMLRLSMTR